MPNTRATPVKDLVIDLKNFRTVKQADELQAVQAMIAIGPEEIWALIESLADDGYLPTENIIVLEGDAAPSQLLVKEGNRRVAALKLLHGYLPVAGLPFPDHILKKISGITSSWKTTNELVPCAVYSSREVAIVDKIVALTHGKTEKAGRHPWNSVARARHNRDESKASENGLDLLEKYLVHGENLSKLQAKLWSGKYPLTVLDDALGKLALKFGARSGRELSKAYPALDNKAVLDDILLDIGVEIITFPILRSQKDFLDRYPTSQNNSTNAAASSQQGNDSNASSAKGDLNSRSSQPQGSSATSGTSQAGNGNGATTNSASASGQAASTNSRNVAAVAINDPRSVKRTLKKFVPMGSNRQKVVTLRIEAGKLDLADNPIAFCFLLRSMFEISAKAYCDDHSYSDGPSFTKKNGAFNTLEDVLREVTQHLTTNNTDLVMVKKLHGAMTELAKKDSILSVTSLNQLVHNPTFSVVASEIPTSFGNVFPLLEAMNS